MENLHSSLNAVNELACPVLDAYTGRIGKRKAKNKKRQLWQDKSALLMHLHLSDHYPPLSPLILGPKKGKIFLL